MPALQTLAATGDSHRPKFPSLRAKINCLSQTETQRRSLPNHYVTENHLGAQPQSWGAFQTHISQPSRQVRYSSEKGGAE